MDNTPSPLPPPKPAKQAPFENWTDCSKVIKQLPPSKTEQERQALLDRIQASPQNHAIAFEILWALQSPRFEATLGWLKKPMLEVLGGGSEEPNLALKTVPTEAASWVFGELREVHTLDDWKKFATSGRHLWVLLAILKSTANKPVMVESLAALAECVEHCQNTTELGKRKKLGISADDTRWIAKLIKSHVPPGSDLSAAFLKALYAVNATAELSTELRHESNALQNRLQTTVEALASERQARRDADARILALEVELAETKAALASAKTELAGERLHSTRQDGFNAVAKNETVNQVLATVRQGTLHRLENIRVYADRENPNRVEIVDLVGEIERHLAKVEEIIAP